MEGPTMTDEANDATSHHYLAHTQHEVTFDQPVTQEWATEWVIEWVTGNPVWVLRRTEVLNEHVLDQDTTLHCRDCDLVLDHYDASTI